MTAKALTKTFAPFHALWGGAALVFGAALLLASPAEAQVRTHGEGGGSYTVSVMSWRDIPFRTVVRQQYDYSCGSAAVATLLRFHYGTHVTEAEIFQNMFARGDQARIQQVGFSMLDMRSYLEERGFRADGLRLSLDRLATLETPAIALITPGNYRHFVVVKGVTDTHVLVGDPTFGLQTYTRADFEAVWNGVVLAIRNTPEGVSDPIYNAENEWQPWSRAPLGDAQGPISPASLFLSARELYQISPMTPPVPG